MALLLGKRRHRGAGYLLVAAIVKRSTFDRHHPPASASTDNLSENKKTEKRQGRGREKAKGMGRRKRRLLPAPIRAGCAVRARKCLIRAIRKPRDPQPLYHSSTSPTPNVAGSMRLENIVNLDMRHAYTSCTQLARCTLEMKQKPWQRKRPQFESLCFFW